jgi:hypothetical protein
MHKEQTIFFKESEEEHHNTIIWEGTPYGDIPRLFLGGHGGRDRKPGQTIESNEGESDVR